MLGSLLRNAAKQGVSQVQSKAHEIQEKIQGNNPAKKAIQTTLLKAKGMTTDGAKDLLKGKLPSGGVDKLRALNEKAANVSDMNTVKMEKSSSRASNAANNLSDMKSTLRNMKG